MKKRCAWAGDDPLYRDYHDREWGMSVSDDRLLFEKLCLEGFQSGLSWWTILRKRENFRRAHEAGATIIYATDAGIYPHGMAGIQFAYMVEYGMTPMEAIEWTEKTLLDYYQPGDYKVPA